MMLQNAAENEWPIIQKSTISFITTCTSDWENLCKILDVRQTYKLTKVRTVTNMLSVVPCATVIFSKVDKLECIYFTITFTLRYSLVSEFIGDKTINKVKSLSQLITEEERTNITSPEQKTMSRIDWITLCLDLVKCLRVFHHRGVV